MRGRLRKAALGLLVSLLLLVLLEGLSSTLLFAWDAVARFERPIAERRHTVYDAELGWVNAPSLREPDLYGPGRDFTSNPQGFRNPAPIEAAAPAGLRRAIALGDSFTIGYGVGDAESWPARLEARADALQVVNMGQGGYGIDQAWLWYRRDAAQLEHDLVVLAFIGDDFTRMRNPAFRGYGKPLLRAVEGRLEVANVPVPRGSLRFPLLTQNLKLLQRLRVVELATRGLRKLGRGGAPAYALDEPETRRVAAALFADLRATAAARGARVALVLLPNLDHRDLSRVGEVPAYAVEACADAAAAGIPFLDLRPAFQALEDGARRALFIPKGELELPGAAGHYNAAGNDFVAERILAWLVEQGLL